MHADDQHEDPGCAGQPLSMTEARLAQLSAENRRLRQAVHEARITALQMAATACAAAEVPSEAGGVWYLGLTDATTRQACTEAIQRLLYAECSALTQAEAAEPSADVVRLGG